MQLLWEGHLIPKGSSPTGGELLLFKVRVDVGILRQGFFLRGTLILILLLSVSTDFLRSIHVIEDYLFYSESRYIDMFLNPPNHVTHISKIPTKKPPAFVFDLLCTVSEHARFNPGSYCFKQNGHLSVYTTHKNDELTKPFSLPRASTLRVELVGSRSEPPFMCLLRIHENEAVLCCWCSAP